MSKTIDERVVEMRFDNKHFESNVQTTLSTLEKLKQSLRFQGATKGLEDVNAAAKNVDMSKLGGSVDTVQAKFSALQVIGITALTNLTNSAIEAGKKIYKALNMDAVMSGFREYETQINAVQTILANTQHKGSTLDDVNAALDELNTYADKTIYNFTEMTRNIGTFTAAGVDLEKSVTSIKGIANLAAVSGSTSQQASVAMYQLSQALAAGTVKLQDWNSVVNAGMGGELFQNALKRTAEHFGYNVDGMIKKYGSFRESLTQGEWVTAEVLTETLTQLSGAYTEADLIAQGYTKSQAKEIVALADTAVDAATKVKTITQLWDTLKETAQSGWTQTWEIIIGDFEEAKALFSKIYESIAPIIEKMAEVRNKILEGALGSKWGNFTKKINEAGISTETFQKKLSETAKEGGVSLDKLIKKHGSLEKAIKSGDVSSKMIIDTLKKFAGTEKEAGESTEDMTDKLEYFQKVVNDVWRGDYKNGEERVKALTEAGYDYAKVQDLVNKTVDGHKLTLEDLSDTQLENLGYTDDQIKSIRKLAEEADKASTPLNELINNLQKPSGRELLFESLFNIAKAIVNPLKAVKQAWDNIFSSGSTDEKASKLYKFIEGFHSLTSKLVMSKETMEKVTKTFEGLFTVVDIVATVIGGTLKIALETVFGLFGGLDGGILTVASSIGEAVTKFGKWIEESKIITEWLEKVRTSLQNGLEAIQKWIDKTQIFSKSLDAIKEGLAKIKYYFQVWLTDFKNTEISPKDIADAITNGLKKAATVIKEVIGNIKKIVKDGFAAIPEDLVSGFTNGILSRMGFIGEVIVELGKNILAWIKDVLGIHSPSTEFYEIGENSIEGFKNGVEDSSFDLIELFKSIGQSILDTVKTAFEKVAEFAHRTSFEQIFAGGMAVGMFVLVKKMLDTLAGFASPLDALAGALDDIGDGLKKMFKGIAFRQRADGIMKLAIAVGILAASMALLSYIDADALKRAAVALGAIVVALGMMAAVVSIMKPVQTKNMIGLAVALIGLSTSILMITSSLNKLSGLENPESTMKSFFGIMVGLTSIMWALGSYINPKTSANMAKAGAMLIGISVALKIMVSVVKQIEEIDGGAIAKGIGVIALFGLLYSGIISVSRYAGANALKAGVMLAQMSFALMTMTVVIKRLSDMSGGDIAKGTGVVLLILSLFGVIIAASKFAGKNTAKAGVMLLMMSGALLIMSMVIKQMASLDNGEVERGLKVVAAIEVLFAAIIAVSALAGKNAIKAGVMLIAMSTALLILTGVLFILTKIEPDGLNRAVGVVGTLVTFFAVLIAATSFAKDCKVLLIEMLIAVALLSGVLIGLTFLDSKDVATATTALATLMGAFSLMMMSTKFTKDTKGSLKSIAEMIVVVGLLSAVVVGLTKLEGGVDSAVKASAALSILMISFAGSLTIMSKAGSLSKTVIKDSVVILGVLAGVAAILGAMSHFEMEASIPTAIALGVLLNAMASALVILKYVGPNSAAAIPAMANIGLIVLEMGIVLGLLSVLKVEPSIETATALSILLVAMSASLILLGKAGTTAPAALAGMKLLAIFIAGAGGLLIAIGALVEYVPKAEELLNKGIPVLEKVGSAIGSFFGNIVGGFAKGVTDCLPAIGDNLAGFMSNAQPFFDGMSDVDITAIEGVESLGSMIMALASSDLMGAVATLLGGGVTTLTDFGKQLANFAPYIVNYAKTVSGIDGAAVESSANAAKTLAEFAAAIPNSGGKIADWIGDNSLATFARELKEFGPSMKAYADSVKGIDGEAVTSSANAGKALAELAQAIPNSGVSLASILVGDNDMATFGTHLVAFGKGMKEYAGVVSGLDSESVEASVKAAKSLVKMADSLPESGGLWSCFSADNDMSTFGRELSSFGSSLKSYGDKVSGVDISAINSSVAAARSIVGFIKGIGKLDTDGIDSLKSALSNLGKVNISNFVNAFKDSAVQMTSIGVDMMTSLVKGVNSAEPLLVITSNTIMMNLLTNLKTKYTLMYVIGIELLYRFVAGINHARARTVTVTNTMLSNMLSAIKAKYTTFYTMGSYLVSGFANGISANSYKAAAKARAMASAAANAAKKELDEHSPSVVGFEIGEYFVIGFANGIEKTTKESTEQSVKMGKDAKEGLEKGLEGTSEIAKKTGEQALAEQKKANDESVKAQEDYWTKMLKARKEAEEKDLKQHKSYADELESQTDSLMNKSGVFDSISTDTSVEPDVKIDGNQLEKNLKGQIEQLEKYKTVMASLQTKLKGTSLWETVSGLGTDSMDKLQAINSMTDKKLSEYVKLYDKKYALAKDTAVAQLSELKDESEKIEDEAFQKELLEFQEEILTSTKDKLASYTDELERNTDALMNRSRIFESVNEQEEVKASQLTTNLKAQVDQLEQYKTVMDSLQTKLSGTNLLSAVSEMGVDSLAQLEALDGMTSKKLDEYVALYDQKYALAKGMAENQLTGLKTETEKELTELYGGAAVNLDEFMKVFDGTFKSISEYVAKSVTVGGEMSTGISQGIAENAHKVTTETVTTVDSSIEEGGNVAEKESPTIGKFLVMGFAKGIDKNTFRAEARAKAMAEKALQAAREALGVASPSKEFYKIGNFAGLGFINALGDYGKKTYKAGSEMAMAAKNGLSYAIGKVRDVIDSDMDVQPTIRPVLDLSDVRAGAGMIGDMLGFGTPVTALANVGSINAMMNRRLQNGVNDDVISAINNLGRKLGNMSGDTYQINGVTYDDGSNISEAVKALVRAARVERRV